jgi:dynein heavy chain
MLFDNVCRSLFEKDKLLFSFTITHRLLTGEHGETKIKSSEWRYFLAGPTGDIYISENPTDWINKNEWNNFYRQLKYMNDNFIEMKGFEDYFYKNHAKFQVIYDNSYPDKCPLPDQWDDLSEFLKLCVLKMIRPDKLISGIQAWIERNIGRDFIEPPGFNIVKSYKESSNIIPLIFILSPGSDPINDIREFADAQGKGKSFDYVSLGRGQEKKAIERLEDMKSKGGWVLLQNCHLAESFMSKLEEIVENFESNWPDKDFRLWLTSMTTDKFPVSVLQSSVKITIEPPKGLKSNLLRTYTKLENKDLDDCDKKELYRGFIFSLSFFHAIVQDRRKYGPIGWNVKYDFTTEDWTVSKKQIKIFLERYEIVPYKVLEYLIADINYGGRVTDDKDQRLIKSILKLFLTENVNFL